MKRHPNALAKRYLFILRSQCFQTCNRFFFLWWWCCLIFIKSLSFNSISSFIDIIDRMRNISYILFSVIVLVSYFSNVVDAQAVPTRVSSSYSL